MPYTILQLDFPAVPTSVILQHKYGMRTTVQFLPKRDYVVLTYAVSVVLLHPFNRENADCISSHSCFVSIYCSGKSCRRYSSVSVEIGTNIPNNKNPIHSIAMPTAAFIFILLSIQLLHIYYIRTRHLYRLSRFFRSRCTYTIVNIERPFCYRIRRSILSLSLLLVIMWNASFPSFACCYFLYLYYTTAAACPPLETLDNLFLENLTRKRAHAGTADSLCAHMFSAFVLISETLPFHFPHGAQKSQTSEFPLRCVKQTAASCSDHLCIPERCCVRCRCHLDPKH